MSFSPPAIFLAATLALPCVARANSPAREPRLSLDYQAQPEGCPSGARFSDEVSSRLGFVPWEEGSPDTLRVRIHLDGEELVASMELPDGSSKVLRAPSCREVSAALAAAVAVALDTVEPELVPQPQPQPAARPAVREESFETATVHVRSQKAGTRISLITQRAVYSRGTRAKAYETLCFAPCSFEIEPGYRELEISDSGPRKTVAFELVEGDNYLLAKPGSNVLGISGATIGTVGILAALWGGIEYLGSGTDYEFDPETGEDIEVSERSGWELPLALGGIAGMGVGLGMMYMAQSDFGYDPEPSRASGNFVSKAVSVQGSF